MVLLGGSQSHQCEANFRRVARDVLFANADGILEQTVRRGCSMLHGEVLAPVQLVQLSAVVNKGHKVVVHLLVNVRRGRLTLVGHRFVRLGEPGVILQQLATLLRAEIAGAIQILLHDGTLGQFDVRIVENGVDQGDGAASIVHVLPQIEQVLRMFDVLCLQLGVLLGAELFVLRRRKLKINNGSDDSRRAPPHPARTHTHHIGTGKQENQRLQRARDKGQRVIVHAVNVHDVPQRRNAQLFQVFVENLSKDTRKKKLEKSQTTKELYRLHLHLGSIPVATRWSW